MRPDLGFRLLHHLTLALAGACLVAAEQFFLPDLYLALAPYLLLVALAFFLDGRWALPAWGANVLGLAIAAGAAWWLQHRLSDADSWAEQVALPAAAIPYLGPVLLALLLVKLFRPRAPRDFWLLQGMGLMQVGLGCVLASGPVFGALLLAYLLCGLACVAAFHQTAGGAAPSGGAARWLLRALLWAPAVAALALPLFLLTPRADGPEWDPFERFGARPGGPAAAQTGFRDEIDLNRTGVLQTDDAVAFTVTAHDDRGRPKLDLPADQRWRGSVLDSYENGRWASVLRQTGGAPLVRAAGAPRFDVGPEPFTLAFTVQPLRAGGLFLAEPVWLGQRPGQLPVFEPGGRDRHPPTLFAENASTVSPVLLDSRPEYRYRQRVSAAASADRYPAVRLSRTYVESLARQPLPALGAWTADRLRALAAQPRYARRWPGPLPAAAPGDGDRGLRPEQWEAAARLLADDLARGGEYTYTLDLRRHDPALDPAEDFLVHVKQGHCERYATGLALMLRSVGVPARVVKGFRGAEHLGDGHYAVRQSHAHAWVEALVPRGDPDEFEFDWIALDPTPAVEAPPGPTFSLARWWEQQSGGGRALWNSLIVDYGATQQADLWEELTSGRLAERGLDWFTGWPAIAAVAAVGAWLAWALARRRARRAAVGGAAFYGRLLELLARYAHLRPARGQTPREFAAAAGPALAARAGALADLPREVAELFYRVRYGGRALAEDEARALEARLDALAGTLRAARFPH